MAAGVQRPAGRGRGRGLRTETTSEGQVGVVNGAAGGGATSWGSGNFGAPVVSTSPAPVEDSSPLIDWDSINANREESERARWAHLPKMVKNFYKEHPEVTARSEEEVALFRRASNNIEVKNFSEEDSTPFMKPIQSFEEAFHNFPGILATIKKQGFQFPSPIQCQAWPYLLAGQDMIGVAQTGTGKTLAFLLPCMVHIDNQELPRGKRGGPNVLIMAPTRELALQIGMEVDKYEYKKIKSVVVYGGADVKEQVQAIKKGVEIIIATPGRFNDLVNRGVISLESITYVVLDEADRMLDMGFEPQIKKTLLDIRPDRQTVMTSATWPEGVRRLAVGYMKSPVTVFIGSLDLAAVHSVTQKIIRCSNEKKDEELFNFLTKLDKDEKVIVFVNRKAKASEISAECAMRDIVVESIHGNRAQEDREQALRDLKSGEVKILIATDVASRGIDIGDVTHVYNFDFPKDMEEYVHRVGRTGRAGKTGTSISLWERADWRKASELIGIMEEAGQDIPEWLRGEAIRYAAWRQRKDEQGDGDGGRPGPGGGLRGGRGGRGGGGGDGCFKCGESGHFSRECPMGGGGGSGAGFGTSKCHNCGEIGHFARECSGSRGGRFS